jgi:hypothetical protein
MLRRYKGKMRSRKGIRDANGAPSAWTRPSFCQGELKRRPYNGAVPV